MAQRPSDVAELLAIARELVVQRDFDAEVVIELFDVLWKQDLDAQLVGAVTHARLVAVASQSRSTAHTTVARFALARVIALLEKQVAMS